MKLLNHFPVTTEEEVEQITPSSQDSNLDEILSQSKVDIERCIALIMGRYKFFGEFVYKFRVIYTYRVETMATDGKNFFVNPLFCSTLNDKQIVFILCHEILHNVLVHFLRQSNKDAEHRKWNYATDHEINLMLSEEGLLSSQQIRDEIHGLCDEIYKEMAAEEIYDRIPELPPLPDMMFPVEIGSMVKTKGGKYGEVTAINLDGTYDIKEITEAEARKKLIP